MKEIQTATVAACTGVLGRSLVKQLIENGTKVAGFVRPGSEREASDLVAASEGRFSVFGGDMTDPKGCEKLIRAAVDSLGAAPAAHFHAAGSFEWVTWSDVSKEAVEKLWSSNYTTAWALGREIFKVMQ